MDLFQAALLGLLQALTEFLPVSSSGHLVIGQALLGVDMGGGIAFEVAVHLGTLLSVLVLLWRDVGQLFLALGRLVRSPGQIAQQFQHDAQVRLGVAILIGCLPAGVIGVLFKDEIEAAFGSVTLVAVGLIFTGCVLLSTKLMPRGIAEVTPTRALLIGLAQAIAILPGVSRSGSTIASALFLRVQPEAAARYSFLLSLPVVAGACLLKTLDLLKDPPGVDLLAALAVGALVSFVGGLAALKLVFAVVRRGWFPHFGWYCLAVGITTLVVY